MASNWMQHLAEVEEAAEQQQSGLQHVEVDTEPALSPRSIEQPPPLFQQPPVQVQPKVPERPVQGVVQPLPPPRSERPKL